MARKEINIEQSASQVAGQSNENMAELAALRNVNQSELTELSEDMTATAFVDALNGNFEALYDGAGSSQGDDNYEVFFYRLQGSGEHSIDLRQGDKVTAYGEPRTNQANNNQVRLWSYFAMSTVKVGDTFLFKGDKNYKSGADARVITDKSLSYQGVTVTLENDYSTITTQSGMFIIKVERPVNGSIPDYNPLYGKRWLSIGASMTTEQSGYSDVSYVSIIADKLHMRVENTAIGGTHVNYHFNYLGSEFKSVWGDYDIITVLLGTNDFYLMSNSLKGYTCVNSDDYPQDGINTTLEGGTYSAATPQTPSMPTRYQLLAEKLKSLWPNAMIVFISVIKRFGDGQIIDYTNAVSSMRNVCAHCNIHFVNLYDAISPYTLDERKKYFIKADGSDGTHPNRLAHELFLAPRIQKVMLEAAMAHKSVQGKIITYIGGGDVSSVDMTSSTITIGVRGINLSDKIIVAVSNSSFSVPETNASNHATELISNGWSELVITHDGEDTSAVITFTSGSVTKELTVNYTAS